MRSIFSQIKKQTHLGVQHNTDHVSLGVHFHYHSRGVVIKVFFNASISITFRDKTSPFITLSLLFTLLTYVQPRCIHLPISQRTPKTIGIHICFQIKGKEHMYKKTKINRSTQMHQIPKDMSFVEMNDTCLDDCKPQDNSSDFMSHILISSFPSNPHPPPILNPLPIGNC